MPRFVAPPPSGEFSIRLTKSFGTPIHTAFHGDSYSLFLSGQTPTEKIEFIGEPNRSSNVKVTNHVGAQNQTILTKEGSVQA